MGLAARSGTPKSVIVSKNHMTHTTVVLGTGLKLVPNMIVEDSEI